MHTNKHNDEQSCGSRMCITTTASYFTLHAHCVVLSSIVFFICSFTCEARKEDRTKLLHYTARTTLLF